MKREIPICEIFHVPATGWYGFSYHFAGRPPHYTLNTCRTLQDALDNCDPHKEHVWEEASDADANKILISRGYKPGSGLDRMTRF